MKFIILLLSFFLSYGVAIFAADQKIASRSINFKDDENAEKIEALTKELQSLLGRIEVLEHTVLSLRSEAGQKDILTENSSEQTKDITNSEVSDDVFEVPLLKVAPVKTVTVNVASVNIGGEAESKKPVIKSSNGEKQAYDSAIIALKDAKMDRAKLVIAEQKFANFIKDFPKSSLQSNAYFWYGETFFRREIYDQAAISYLKGYKNSPKGDKASDSLLKLSYSLGYSKRQNDACGIITKLETEFPGRSADSIKKAKEAKVKFGCQQRAKS